MKLKTKLVNNKSINDIMYITRELFNKLDISNLYNYNIQDYTQCNICNIYNNIYNTFKDIPKYGKDIFVELDTIFKSNYL